MPNKVSLWRSTPPAIFPVALGFLGLALAWRNSAGVLPVPAAIGELLLGVSTAFFVFFALSYFAKAIRRSKAVLEDMKTPPARAGLAALSMAIMLLAAALLPFGAIAGVIWWVGVVLFLLTACLITFAMIKGPKEARQFSPFQYLVFVGSIVAPIAGVSLGYSEVSFWLAMLALIGFVVLSVGYGAKFMRVRPPVPLRPSLAILLAPVSLFAMAFFQFEIIWAFTLFYWLAIGVALVLLAASLWLTSGGFTPLWGAFTFPIAAFANMQAVVLADGPNIIASTFLIAALLIGTPLILFVVWKTSKAWLSGGLAKKTAASVA